VRLEFGRSICNDLAAAERREWLVTNGFGGFASGTIAGTLTRRYHGLLIAAFAPPTERMLLVTKIDETARYRGGDYQLAANRWRDGYLSPLGFTSIERFYLDGTTPVWEFALADALVEKRVWMEPGANRTFVRYCFLRGSDSIELALRVLVNYRSFHGNTHAGDWHVEIVAQNERCLRVNAIPGGRSYWLAADAGSIAIENVWYHDFVLSQETLRGLDDRDDNLAAGSLSVTLAAKDAVTIVASDTPLEAVESDRALEHRRHYEAAVMGAYERATPAAARPPWWLQGILAADQFVVVHPVATDPQTRSVIAGYHWFGDWGRDTMIALPGVTLTTGRAEIARAILATFASFVDGGLLPNFFPDDGRVPEYNAVDAPLWFVEAAARYAESTGDETGLRAMWPSLRQVIACYRAGTRYGIHLDDDGLIVAAAPGVQLTWMDAKVGDRVVTPRMGKPIEVAALWYNALCRMYALALQLGDDAAREYAALGERARAGFDRFWNAATGYCFDVLDGPDGDDPTLRPNQIFAVALPHAALPLNRARAVVDVCAAQLLTSNGLRSLAPSDSRFVPFYRGSPSERDAAYHQGTVWAWLLGPFALAHARVYRDLLVARSFLSPLVDAFFDDGLGSVGEIADATAPFTPRGAIAQAWSVGELLRAWHEIPSAAQAGLTGPFKPHRQ